MTARVPGGLIEEALTESVIGAFFKVHNTLGYGFLESVYAAALELELHKRGHRVQREVPVVVWYEGIAIANQRIDTLVDAKLILELKSTERLHTDATRQLYNYLRATNIKVGLLLHFTRYAEFYRVVCSNKESHPVHPRNSLSKSL